jgi:hypothetical protein
VPRRHLCECEDRPTHSRLQWRWLSKRYSFFQCTQFCGLTVPPGQAYTINGKQNPDIVCQLNDVLVFNVNAQGYPFYIKSRPVSFDRRVFCTEFFSLGHWKRFQLPWYGSGSARNRNGDHQPRVSIWAHWCSIGPLWLLLGFLFGSRDVLHYLQFGSFRVLDFAFCGFTRSIATTSIILGCDKLVI